MITEPIPAGASVLADSVRGSFERYEVSPGTITFYVGDAPYPGELHYTLVGYVPGTFRVAPTVVRSFYEPQRIAVSTRKTFDVLPHGYGDARRVQIDAAGVVLSGQAARR